MMYQVKRSYQYFVFVLDGRCLFVCNIGKLCSYVYVYYYIYIYIFLSVLVSCHCELIFCYQCINYIIFCCTIFIVIFLVALKSRYRHCIYHIYQFIYHIVLFYCIISIFIIIWDFIQTHFFLNLLLPLPRCIFLTDYQILYLLFSLSVGVGNEYRISKKEGVAVTVHIIVPASLSPIHCMYIKEVACVCMFHYFLHLPVLRDALVLYVYVRVVSKGSRVHLLHLSTPPFNSTISTFPLHVLPGFISTMYFSLI